MERSFYFFFFKQKTAYEISLGLVGSEMCIRDRTTGVSNPHNNIARLALLLLIVPSMWQFYVAYFVLDLETPYLSHP